MRLATVEVNRNGTKVIINKSDFTPGKDALWETAQNQSAKVAMVKHELPVEIKIDEKTALAEEITRRGLKADRRMSVARLKQVLEEADVRIDGSG